MQILKDDLDDHEFLDIATQILQDIVENAKRVANKDEVVTDDEMRLLEKLTETLKSEELF